jgi:hypothetical protein
MTYAGGYGMVGTSTEYGMLGTSTESDVTWGDHDDDVVLQKIVEICRTEDEGQRKSE